MEVIALSLLVAILLLIAESIALWTAFSAKSVMFRVSAQAVLLLLVPPTYLLAANVLIYLETEDGKVMVVSEMPSTWDIPPQCKNIEFHRDPGGEWFSCEIGEQDAKLWLLSRSFGPGDNFQCSTEIESTVSQSVSQPQAKANYFQTPTEENGAGLSAVLNGKTLLVCQWYW